MKRNTLLGALLAVMMAAVVALAFGSVATTTAQTPEDSEPQSVVEDLVEAFNEAITTGNGAIIADFFAEDGYFTTLEPDIDGVNSFGVFGRAALEAAFSQESDPEFHVTVTEISASGNEVTGRFENVDSRTIEAGVERVVGEFTAVVEDGEVVSFHVQSDLSDAQTAEYAAYLASLEEDHEEEEEGPPPADLLLATMAGNQIGEAFFSAEEAGFAQGVMFGGIGIDSGPADELQPAGIHEGTCDDIGGLVTRVAPVYNGGSFSILSLDISHLAEGGHVLAVSASEDDDTIVSCGAIEAAPEGPGLPDTGTGGPQTSDDSNGLMWLIAALGIGGAVIAGAGVVVARRR